MLKITTVRQGSQTTLKLEGKLLAPWIEEFHGACCAAEIWSGHVGLDLADLIYADAVGTQCLRNLLERGVPIIACSAFVAELLRKKLTPS